jgi:cell division protease FtsH
VWALAGALIVALFASSILPGSSGDKIAYDEFTQAVRDGTVQSIEVDNNSGKIEGVRIVDGVESEFTTNGPLEPSAVDRALWAANIPEGGVVFKTPTPGFLSTWLPFLLFPLLFLGFFLFMQRRAQGQMGSVMSIGRSKAKTYSSERPGTTFDDVAGYAPVKQEITEVVDFLKKPERFAEIGARIPKGVLLVGPPGTGKTLIARAVAGEAGVPFLSVTGSDFMEMFVGVGASRVRDLFQTARKMGRAIIFIDEIDSIGRKRGAGLGGGHDEREQTLNQMLSEMDGFEATEGIVMIAATNRPDILDPALLRPGRFDRQVIVPLPELEDRKAILKVHIKSKKVSPDVDLNVVARGTPGMSGADLANLVNEAALFAVRQGEDVIRPIHFDQARDRVILGVERDSMVQTQEDLEKTAYHEAGHAICAAVLPENDPVHKVTIIPTSMALGVTMTLPKTDRYKMEQREAEARIVMMLGGRNAEALVFNDVTSGAADDLRQATDLARRMVTEWGMSERIGPMSLTDPGPVFLGDDMMQSKKFSDETAALVDEETKRILQEQEARCAGLLAEHRNALDLIARALLEHETISGAEVNRLIGIAGAEPGVLPEPVEVASNSDDADVQS